MTKHVNLNLLRSLKVLLEECHVSQAAARLNLTQSAVSRHLSQLRELFADPLLIRDGNLLVPTPKALQLQQQLATWFVALDNMMTEEVFEPSLWHGEFVLSSSDYVAQYILPELVNVFAEQSPHLTLNYQLWHPHLIDQLNSSGIHLASSMSLARPEGVCSLPIGEDRCVCLMSLHHPLAKQTTLCVDDLLAYAHIKIHAGGDKDSFVEQELSKLGLARRITLNVPFFSAAAQALCKQPLLLVTPEHIARHLAVEHELTYKPLPIPTPLDKYWLVWHEKYDKDPSHIWVRNLVRQVMTDVKASVGYDLKS
ncbi:LysR family transcriptional regulator [Marinomonas gallaica]|uniref:LysR family transcriptional regulator n=1 Tax=Marinomonas gallaica TaxID=1806667 RepID=UPI003A8EC3E7